MKFDDGGCHDWVTLSDQLLSEYSRIPVSWNTGTFTPTHFYHQAAASSPRVTASVLLLKVIRGSSGPGDGATTHGHEGATLQSTVGGYWAPEEGAEPD